ncbi:MAG: hypothetical protein M3N25_06460, partial [Actinomycetota bacterium]|nr:hypothetical protein [Actinomycetota bacterium]
MTTARGTPPIGRRTAFFGLLFAAVLAMLMIFGVGTAHADQTASVTNDGSATADTGGNGAVGNASDNTATNDQEATAQGGGGDAVASNSGGASNKSDGTAVVKTGDATAAGSTSNTAVSQKSSGSGGADQGARVSNTGSASANTGGNRAVGNRSENVARNNQNARAGSGGPVAGGDAVAFNAGGASNRSDGTAVVKTGDATALGVASTTAVNQQSHSGGGLVAADQTAVVVNDGTAVANTGGNVAVGNASRNLAVNVQDAEADAGLFFGWGDAVAFNVGKASNYSDGTAVIVTGDAKAIGVAATTVVNQAVHAAGCQVLWWPGCLLGGLVVADQTAVVVNEGFAVANTGDNRAVGNRSRNLAVNVQVADADADGLFFGGGDAVAFNVGGASNYSDGTAVIVTGDAKAIGVAATTVVNQAVRAAGCQVLWCRVVWCHTGCPHGCLLGGLVVADQTAVVVNEGFAVANTGDNRAIGNRSRNLAVNVQDAEADADGFFFGADGLLFG